MSAPALRIVGAAVRVCSDCNVEKPLDLKHFRPTPHEGCFRKRCRNCDKLKNLARDAKARKAAAAVKAMGVRKWIADAPGGGYAEKVDAGIRFMGIPDSHGHHVDQAAAAVAMAAVSYFRPTLIVLLGDHVDFGAVSRHPKSPDEQASLLDDIEAAKAFLRELRARAPHADILYLQGNHEVRLQRYLWSNAAAIHKLQGLQVPTLLDLGELRIAYEESGVRDLNASFMAKHGNFVRGKSGASGMAEMERNGISGMSGHTHRGGLVLKRNRKGVTRWMESGCLCNLEPGYAEGQTADWVHGFTYGALLDDRRGAYVNFAEIVEGRVWMGDREISA